MDYENLLETVKWRHSIRRYKPDPVPLEDVMKVLEVARWAPSGNNMQPWEFVVVREKEKLRQVTEIFIAQSIRLREKTANFTNAPNKDYLSNVSTMIFVCADPRFKPAFPRGANPELDEIYRENRERIYIATITAAVCHILLAATSLGLGTAWLTGAAEEITEAQLRRVLKIPEVLDIICGIPLGYPPQRRPSPRIPRPRESMVHFDEFDTNKWRTDEEAERLVYDNHRSLWAEFYKTGEIPQKQ